MKSNCWIRQIVIFGEFVGDKRKWIWFCTMEKLSMDPKKVFLEIFSMEKNRGEKGKVEIWFFIITVSRIQFDLQLDSSLYTII